MNTPSFDTLRKELISQRIEFQNQANHRLTLEALHQSILVVLNEIELITNKKLTKIGFYSAIRGEPNIQDSLIKWQKMHPNRKLALPICQPENPLTFHAWDTTTQMQSGFAKILEPYSTPVIEVDLLFVPCVGWQIHDKYIWRLGYGGGFYDRTLQAWEKLGRRPICIGIAYEFAQITQDKWHPKAHDYPLDGLITDSQYYFSPSIAS
jgi:5,10-methenyltetrahydrofolate synthetase